VLQCLPLNWITDNGISRLLSSDTTVLFYTQIVLVHKNGCKLNNSLIVIIFMLAQSDPIKQWTLNRPLYIRVNPYSWSPFMTTFFVHKRKDLFSMLPFLDVPVFDVTVNSLFLLLSSTHYLNLIFCVRTFSLERSICLFKNVLLLQTICRLTTCRCSKLCQFAPAP